MRIRRKRTGFVSVAAVMAAMLCGAMPTAIKAQTSALPRGPDGHPSLNGIWQSLNTANWDIQEHAARSGPVLALGAVGAEPPGLGVVEGNELPYLPAAAAKKKENFENRLTADPEVKCYMPGVPRAAYMPYPFQIIQTPKYVLMAYEYAGANRTIFMDKAAPPPADSWMGHSVGHWEGDTLVVETNNIRAGTLDRNGVPYSDKMTAVERIRRVSPTRLEIETTLTDPEAFVTPFTMKRAYVPMPRGSRFEEYICENNKDL
jgi:hypothetical protein